MSAALGGVALIWLIVGGWAAFWVAVVVLFGGYYILVFYNALERRDRRDSRLDNARRGRRRKRRRRY